jgi:glycosyltransferase involved in cell wall biosynthesis
MGGILVFFHCPSNTGYAIGRHEYTFSQMAYRLMGSYDSVHFGYPKFIDGPSSCLPSEISNFVRIDTSSHDKAHGRDIVEYVKRHQIQVAFGFDQPVSFPGYKFLRKGGVRYLFSYWGAPMASIGKGVKLLLRRMECRLSPYGPDHYIFQSEGMRETAVYGRGIARERTSVVRSGVDVGKFSPSQGPNWYAHDALGIDRNRKIVYYSGHMERRKGVHVIVAAAAHIINNLHRKDLHFLFLGNRGGEETVFDPLYRGTEAESYITFGGYRDDVAQLQSASYMAVIATTGWDSHTMTAVEVAASGLPLVVSDVPGLREAVAEDTGLLFPAEDHLALAERICTLADDGRLRQQMGAMARERVLKGYTREHQIAGLEAVVRQVAGPILQG